MLCQQAPNGICSLLQWNQLEFSWSPLHSGLILIFQNQLDTLSFFFPDMDLCSGARKPLQPHYKIEFHALACCCRCSLCSVQVGDVQMNSECQHFLSVHFLGWNNRQNILYEWTLWTLLATIFPCVSLLKNISLCGINLFVCVCVCVIAERYRFLFSLLPFTSFSFVCVFWPPGTCKLTGSKEWRTPAKALTWELN